MTSLLIVPGLGGSGPDHWQSQWEAIDPRCTRVEQESWDQPVREAWVDTLQRAVVAAPVPVILIAHSLGCVTVAHWAVFGSVERVRGALLVAPADTDCALCKQVVPRSFAPMPSVRLPFRSIVVASTDDPYASIERARWFAAQWGAEFEDVGARGHINADSQLGVWEQGRALLARLL